jgi:hypothetical protein
VNGPFLDTQNSTLQYHEANPTFCDEIKMQLPLDLNEGDHLLFSFVHVSLSNAQKVQSNEPVEQNVGYSWVPLISDSSLTLENDVQEYELPLASVLTPDYFTHDPTGIHRKVT